MVVDIILLCQFYVGKQTAADEGPSLLGSIGKSYTKKGVALLFSTKLAGYNELLLVIATNLPSDLEMKRKPLLIGNL